jgi:hypothetical protein
MAQKYLIQSGFSNILNKEVEKRLPSSSNKTDPKNLVCNTKLGTMSFHQGWHYAAQLLSGDLQ